MRFCFELTNNPKKNFMKKLIPLLSLTVLSSCSQTTQTKANLMPVVQELAQIEDASFLDKPLPLSHQSSRKADKKLHKTPEHLENHDAKKGVASWYGDQFHGKKTATGEFFDMYGMTAAHRNLPLDSYAQVTNLENHRTVIVRINDRGPFFGERVLDLSYSAAKQLGMNEAGTSKVEIKTIAPQQALKQMQQQHQPIYLQVGSFNNKKLAEELVSNLKKEHLPSPKIAASSHKNATLYKVEVPIQSAKNATELHEKLAKLGIKDTPFVTETN
jgi:rare lipoprotein A